MTRKEWFAALARNSARLPGIGHVVSTGLMCSFGEVRFDSKDTDPAAATFIVRGLHFLESQSDKSGNLNPMLFRRPDGRHECGFPDRLGEFVEDARLDAVGNAVAAWLEAQNGS
jgi:hypothetical protein